MKFADDLTSSIPVKSGASNSNSAANEVQSIVEWTSVNRMQLNFKKTWEMLLKGKSTKAFVKLRIELNKRLHYTPLSSVNSPPTSPFYTVLYANQVPVFLER